MEPRRGAVVQRRCPNQHPLASLLPGPQAALPAIAGPALPPARALRLLPPVGGVYNHPREPGCFTSAIHQVSAVESL